MVLKTEPRRRVIGYMARSWLSRRVGKKGERVLEVIFMESGVMMVATGVEGPFSVVLRRVDIWEGLRVGLGCECGYIMDVEKLE